MVRDDRFDMVRSDNRPSLQLLWGAFAVQVTGRLLDFWWHATHDEFETGGDQLQAHWLVWIGTLLVLLVGVNSLRRGVRGPQRTGYVTVVVANGPYVPMAVAHFIQHLNRQGGRLGAPRFGDHQRGGSSRCAVRDIQRPTSALEDRPMHAEPMLLGGPDHGGTQHGDQRAGRGALGLARSGIAMRAASS
jgi:hypothetical protein